MPRVLDLNYGRDSWIAVNDLTANVEFSDQAVGPVDWAREARKRGNVYAGMRDNRRARFPSAPKPTCAKQFYDVARPGIGRDGRDATSRRGFAFQQQPRKQCSGGKWWEIVRILQRQGLGHRQLRRCAGGGVGVHALDIRDAREGTDERAGHTTLLMLLLLLLLLMLLMLMKLSCC